MARRLNPYQQVIAAVERRLERSKANMHADMKRGLGGLGTIASTAPFVGLLGTVLDIMNCFKGYSGTPTRLLAIVSSGISEALITTALGLLVAVPAAWSYNVFASKIETFDKEAENSSLELLNYLAMHLGRCRRAKETQIGFR